MSVLRWALQRVQCLALQLMLGLLCLGSLLCNAVALLLYRLLLAADRRIGRAAMAAGLQRTAALP